MTDVTSKLETGAQNPGTELGRPTEINIGTKDNPEMVKVIGYTEEKLPGKAGVIKHYIVEGEYPGKGMVYDRDKTTDILVDSRPDQELQLSPKQNPNQLGK